MNTHSTNDDPSLSLLDHCIQTLKWDTRLDRDIYSILHDFDNKQDTERLSYALRVAPYKYAKRFYLYAEYQQWYDHGYDWVRHILNQEGERETLRLIKKVFRSDDPHCKPSQEYFIKGLSKKAAQHNDIKILDFCKKTTFPLKDTFVLSIINEALEFCSPKALDWALEQSPSFKSMRMPSRMVRCINMENDQGLELACQFVCNHHPTFWKELPIEQKEEFFHPLLKNYSNNTWECLKTYGFLDALPLDFKGIEIFGRGYVQFQLGSKKSDHVGMINDMIDVWEEKGIDWITPFVGGMSQLTSTLQAFFHYFPNTVPASLPILGSYYIEKNKDELPSLYAYYEKLNLLGRIEQKNSDPHSLKKKM